AARLGFPGERMIVAAGGRGDGVTFGDLLDAPAIAGPAGAEDESICLMLYTSGTPGRAKGVARPQRARPAPRASPDADHRYRPGESALGVMPMFHTMGVRSLLASALVNGKLVCMSEYAPAELLRITAAERLTSLFLVPTMFHDILRERNFGSLDLSSLS